MSEGRRASRFNGLDLDGLDDDGVPARPSAAEIDQRATMPRREPRTAAELRKQNNISLPLSQDQRFAALCQREGKSKTQMLIAMMDMWEGR